MSCWSSVVVNGYVGWPDAEKSPGRKGAELGSEGIDR